MDGRPADVPELSETKYSYKYEPLEHLKIIQALVARLASQALAIKNFAVTVAAAVFAVYFNSPQWPIPLIGFFAILFFWMADAYCNGRAVRYWALYNEISGMDWYDPAVLRKGNYGINLPVSDKLEELHGWFDHTFFKVFYLPLCILFLLLSLYAGYQESLGLHASRSATPQVTKQNAINTPANTATP
jgi:hypothetical protein